jgi:hypothetical protein
MKGLAKHSIENMLLLPEVSVAAKSQSPPSLSRRQVSVAAKRQVSSTSRARGQVGVSEWFGDQLNARIKAAVVHDGIASISGV